MEIIKTKPGDSNFHLFENLPKLLYPPDHLYHKQPDSITMEFLDSCYVLTINKEPKARAALYNNPHLSFNGLKSACIGNYECIEDKEASTYLLTTTIKEAKNLKVDFLIGPMNGSTWDNYRYSTHHQHPNFLLEPWQNLYYNEQLLAMGFTPISKYTSSIDTEISCDHPDVLKLDTEFEKSGVTIRNINMNNYGNELKRLYPFISAAFKTNFLYTPIKWETFLTKYSEAAKIINPEYVLIAEDSEKKIIGFIFCYDDLFNREEKSLVVKTIARDSSKKWSGLGRVMANRVIRLVKTKGYQSLIHAFMIEQGTSVEASKDFLGKTYKNYVLYGIKL